MPNSQKAVADGARLLGEAVEMSDGIFAYAQAGGTWWISNTGFLAFEERICVYVDDLVGEVRHVGTRAYTLIDAAGDGEGPPPR